MRRKVPGEIGEYETKTRENIVRKMSGRNTREKSAPEKSLKADVTEKKRNIVKVISPGISKIARLFEKQETNAETSQSEKGENKVVILRNIMEEMMEKNRGDEKTKSNIKKEKKRKRVKTEYIDTEI